MVYIWINKNKDANQDNQAKLTSTEIQQLLNNLINKDIKNTNFW